MPEIGRVAIQEFRGVARDVHRAKLPDGLFQADEGSNHEDRGVWRTRYGCRRADTTVKGAAIRSLHGFALPGGQDHALIYTSGANVYGKTELVIQEDGGGGTEQTLSTSMDATHRGHTAVFRGRAYLTNGWQKAKVWDGRTGTFSDAGIAGPSQEPGTWTETPDQATAGSVPAGVHAVRYRYMDSSTGYVSNPSEEREITATGSFHMRFTIGGVGTNIVVSSDPKVDTIILEATAVGGREFFEAARADNSAGTITYDDTDVDLAQALLFWPDSGHGLPPIRRYVVSHRGRLWLFGSIVYATGTVTTTNGDATVTGAATAWNTDVLGTSTSAPLDGKKYIRFVGSVDDSEKLYEIDYAASATSLEMVDTFAGTGEAGIAYEIVSKQEVVYVSRADYPESFAPLSWIASPEGDLAGPLTAGVPYGDVMIFFTLQSMFRFTFALEPSEDGDRRPIGQSRGALSQRVVVGVEGSEGIEARLYSMDRVGFHYFNGVEAVHISDPVDELIDDVNWAAVDTFHAAYYPRRRAVRWYVCTGADTQPKNYFEYDVTKGSWSFGNLDVAITESRIALTGNGPQVLWGDENGHLWFGDQGTADGCQAANTHLTVGPGATTTSIPTTSTTLPTTGVGLGGCTAYWLEGDEVVVIASNTSSTLTTAAFSAAPADGDTIWVGRIRSRLKGPAHVGPKGGIKNRTEWRYLRLSWEPLPATRWLLVRVYENYSASAKTWAAAAFFDGPGQGRTFENGVQRPGVDDRFPATDWLVDLSHPEGFCRIPLGAGAVRSLEWELELYEPDAALELIAVELDGREGEPIE